MKTIDQLLDNQKSELNISKVFYIYSSLGGVIGPRTTSAPSSNLPSICMHMFLILQQKYPSSVNTHFCVLLRRWSGLLRVNVCLRLGCTAMSKIKIQVKSFEKS